jgi:hypothetical protein
MDPDTQRMVHDINAIIDFLNHLQDARRTPHQEIDVCIAQHQRAGCTLVWREDNPPRARMCLVVEAVAHVPVEKGATLSPAGRVYRPGKITCLDITIGHDGRALWAIVPCGSDDRWDGGAPGGR